MQVGFSVIALVASAFFGLRACDIFLSRKELENRAWDWWVYQFWLNFAGCLLGWAALWLLIGEVECGPTSQCRVRVDGADFAVFAVAFLGVTGHLPVAMVSSVKALTRVIQRFGDSKGVGRQDND
jgi:hypothetical protein